MATRAPHLAADMTDRPVPRFALFNLGFRPFFLAAMIFACISMPIWMLLYTAGSFFRPAGLAPQLWHAHEMIFGYVQAVIAGFLLTAVRNWTGIQTVRGVHLGVIFILWLGARLALLSSYDASFVVAAVLDILFGALFFLSVTIPIVRARNWKQTVVLLLIAVLITANALFYFGVLADTNHYTYMGLYLGLYVVLGLILIVGGRVLPSFIQSGAGHETDLKHWPFIDRLNLVAYLVFVVLDVFSPYIKAAQWLAGLLFFINATRMWGWHTPGLWKKPMLWILYVAHAFLVLGFALRSMVMVVPALHFLAVHAFAYGAIGLITAGMMARVALGHTGRNVHQPPAILFWVFAALVAGAVVRVMPPLISMAHYPIWIVGSQVAWTVAFALLLWIYFPMLTRPRIDGKDG